MARIGWMVVCVLGVPSLLLHAADCGALKTLKAENTTISVAEAVTSGTLSLADQPEFKGLPAFCRISTRTIPK